MALFKVPGAVSFEDRMASRERRRQIEEANRMLIAAPKKTADSMGLLNFDPSGTFRFAGGRWLKSFEVTGSISSIVDALEKLNSRVRITRRTVTGKGGDIKTDTYISLITIGDIYETVRGELKEDEEVLQEMIGVRSLTADETIETILGQLGEEGSFSYASFVRGRRDLLREISPDMKEERDHFEIDGTFGMSLFVKEYPKENPGSVFSLLEKLGCPVFVTFDLVGISQMDKEDYVRTLEKRYAKNLSSDKIEDFLNISCQISFLCDSFDALKIIAKTVGTVFSRAGYLVSPAYAMQKEFFISQISLGLTDQKILRNKEIKRIKEIIRREYGSNKD